MPTASAFLTQTWTKTQYFYNINMTEMMLNDLTNADKRNIYVKIQL